MRSGLLIVGKGRVGKRAFVKKKDAKYDVGSGSGAEEKFSDKHGFCGHPSSCICGRSILRCLWGRRKHDRMSVGCLVRVL